MQGADAQNAFLGVTSSATGRQWVDRLPHGSLRLVRGLAERLELPEIVARILLARGVEPDAAEAFLAPRLRDLMPDPRSLTDMERAAARLVEAIERRERVGIFGDYDVDGAASSALVHRFLGHFSLASDIHIPDRIFEGYGPNDEAFARFADAGCSLIVTVDCGTASHDTIAAARARGLDVLVIDHHQTGETLPDATALVNPNRQDDISGQGHLCAAGVVFLVLVETVRQLRERGRADLPDLIGWLDVVALATVADVVPLRGLNRAFVAQGLKVMHRRANVGLRALCDAARLRDAPTPYHLGFMLGPRINAGGRIGDAALGARLLTIDDLDQARAIAEQLDRLNAERQAMEKEALVDAMAQAEAQIDACTPVTVISSPQWHPGIVGLIASRVKDRARRPAIAISFAGGDVGTGSARSVAGVDIGAAVRAAVEAGLLAKGGGHAMAAGLTIARGDVERFTDFLSQRLADAVGDSLATDRLKVDGALTAGAASTALVEAIDAAGPYGTGHPEPTLVLPAHRLTYCEATEQGHLRLALAGADGASVKGIAFRAADGPLGAFLQQRRGANIHAAGTLRINRWGSSVSAQLQLRDAADTTAA